MPTATMQKSHEVPATMKISTTDHKMTETETILENQRNKIKEEMKNYRFDHNSNVRNLDDLLYEKGGVPMRIMIVSTFRTGSSFLGEIINSHPATWYHYEPLIEFGSTITHNETEALQNLQKLFECDYLNMERYIASAVKVGFFPARNDRLFDQCKRNHSELCRTPEFVSAICRLFPFQAMKTVRLSLSLTNTLFKQLKNLRILVLIRDPRGIMQSRRHMSWCQNNTCSDTSFLCNNMANDYQALKKLDKLFSNRLRVVRFEDLSLNPERVVAKILQFFGLDFDPKVKKFLESHTKRRKGGDYATFRQSKAVAFSWKNQLDFKKVDEIQKTCKEAMKLWGYVPAKNKKHLLSNYFNPIKPYSI